MNHYTYGYSTQFQQAFTVTKLHPDKISSSEDAEMCDGWLHINEKVRWARYSMSMHKRQFHYIENEDLAHYNGYVYEKTTLTQKEILQTLHEILYKVEPELHNSTMVGWEEMTVETNPNRYEGLYILNDDHFYRIVKKRNLYKFYKAQALYTEDEELIYTGTVNFDVYKLSVEFAHLEANIKYQPLKSLRRDKHHLTRYLELEKELDQALEKMTF